MGSIQNSLTGALGAVTGAAIAVVSRAARAKEGMAAKEKSKKNYELAVQQKQENIKLTKAKLAEVEARTANAEALNKAKAKKINAETKQIKSKTALNAANTDLKTAKTAKINAQVERMAKLAEKPAAVEAPTVEAKKPVQRFGELAGVEETPATKQAPTVEAKKPVQSFGELAGVEEAPAPEQKYISSEEGAYLPIKAENTETKIPVDEDVQGLIQAKQKNMKRSISASRAQKEYQASKGYENDFPIRDYMPNVSDAELRKAGITKTELNKLSSILAGNGTDEDVRNWFEKHGGVDGAYTIKLDDLNVTSQAADAIKNFILNKDKSNDYDSSGEAMKGQDLKQPSVDDWYLNFDRNNNTMSNSDNYKVWQDDSTEEEKDEVKTDRNFSGIKF